MQYSTLRKNKTKQTEDERVKEKAQEPYRDIETHIFTQIENLTKKKNKTNVIIFTQRTCKMKKKSLI